ncbi:MAG TPA: RES family NAD+ phosphorylase [Gemmatimonadaceae bacterium]|nr:RES family NAD+ phosphorylase [Gemmatimonadaceae bacterium]
MSSSIWTLCAGDSELRPFRISPWRVVEAQHQVSTRKLVDSTEEQVLLEEMIDRVKPPDLTGGRLHYLLFTPFRYPPLPHGSRFGGRHEPGIWYGSVEIRCAFAEVSYYRLVFIEGTQADLGTLTTALTAFTVSMRTNRGVDLTTGPFEKYRAEIASPVSYDATQELGADIRAANVEAIRYPAARDAEGGVNVAAFVPSVFGKSKPKVLETWYCATSRERIDFTKGDYFTRRAFTFLRTQFLVKGALPSPAV